MSPFELADYVAAGLTLLIGIGVGRRMRPKPPEPLRPICSCEHGFGSHEDGAKCHGKVEETSRYDGLGKAIAWRKVQCSCLRYDGPHPAIFGLEKH